MISTAIAQDPRVQVGLEKLEKGSRMVREAVQQVTNHPSQGESESKAREGLAILRSAVDWLEDTDYFEQAHKALDDAGRDIRSEFGCHLTFDPENGYSRTCPVDLAHTRVGMSVGYIVEEVECSICRQDPEDCHHITGQTYGDKVCYRVVTRADLLEISFVSRPGQPDARIHRVSVNRNELEQAIGPSFRYGMLVSCNVCLQRCDGMTEWL